VTAGERAAIDLVRRLYEAGWSRERAEAEVLFAIALEQVEGSKRRIKAAVDELERVRDRVKRERERQVGWAEEVERRALVLAEMRLRDDERRMKEVEDGLRDQIAAFEGEGSSRDGGSTEPR
jgi:hypothetical protein